MDEEYIEAIIEKLVPGGDGLARVNGLTVFIPGVLPGERVSARLNKRKKGWARAMSADIMEASPDRRRPFCSLFGSCGGCSLQHMSYSSQIIAKASFCQEALIRQGKFPTESIPPFHITRSPPQGYRCRIRPVVVGGGRAGFRTAESNQVVPVSFCPVATPEVNRFFADIPAGLKPGSEPVVFGESGLYAVEGIHQHAEARVASRRFLFPTGSFFQSNLNPLKELLDFALEGAASAGHRIALDLYGGVGLFGVFLSDLFESVVGVDRDSDASEAWMRHVGDKGRYYAMRLESWVKKHSRIRPDYAIVDPPRTGLSESVRGVLCEMKIPRFTYVSCDPVTQARDLKVLSEAGYVLEAYGVFDLYPQTPHVETVARLRWGGDS